LAGGEPPGVIFRSSFEEQEWVMGYLNHSCLDSVPADPFRKREPYPWVNVEGSLTPEGFEKLRTSLPDTSLFEKHVAKKRAHGQGYHDRYILHYRPEVPLSEPWKEFVAEVQGKGYEKFIRRMFDLPESKKLILTMEWYFGWQGCGVSPHCDAKRKLATHIFYFNTDKDWDGKWGGDILIMDDARKFNAHSAPKFDDLKVAAALDPRGNGSLLFKRTDHSWHGVKPLQSPPGELRKLFIVTINVPNLQVLWRRLRGKDPDGYRISTN
jgi:hypothetical protein